MDCYVVVSEEYYGGAETHVQVFSTRAAAEEYVAKVGNDKLDVIILERIMQ